MRFRAFHLVSAGTVAAALLVAAVPARAADDAAADTCFDAKLTVKEVLDACQAFIDKGSADKKLLIRAHSIRAMGFSATGSLDKALGEMNAAVEIDPKRANSYFMRAAGYEASKDHDKALADLNTAIGIDDKDADFYLLRGTGKSMTYRLPITRRWSSSSRSTPRAMSTAVGSTY